MPDTEQAIITNSQYSVRQFAPTTWGGFIGDSLGFLWGANPDLLPAWGSTACDVALRIMHYTQHNALWGGAVQAWIEKFLSIPYEISGGRNLTFQWQDIFFESEFGEGYDELVSKGLVDYLTLNRGWFMELVSYGEPDTPIREGAKILGINHLDALRIIFTGNREWPYLYQSEWGGGLHKLHTTRVIHIARQPSPNTLLYGMGKSALYDSLTAANAQIMLGRHENELLNDLPPPGIVIFNNVKADEVETAMKQFEYERVRDGQNIYRAPLQMSSKDPSQPASVTFVPMSTVPEGFDYEKYMRVHVNLLALNLGLDPQDVWPLEASAMGSGEQSKVLAAKTDIKGPGYTATRLTRKWNVILPRSLEWKYKAQNAAQDRETANLAKIWIDTANTVSFMNADEKRQLVANQVPAFADVLMDEQGQVRLFDADPKEQTQVIIASDAVEMDTPVPDAEEVTTNSEDESVMVDTPSSALATVPPKPTAITPQKPAPMVVNKPSVPVASEVNNKFKEIQEQLKAGLLTMAQAQSALGIQPDPVYEGMYLVEGFPVPREKVRELWQAHFGRGVASFDAVVTGETLPAGNGSGPVPEYADKQIVPVVRKNIDATGEAFINDVKVAIQDGVDRVTTKAGTAARIRGAIVRYGKPAFQDGLEVGGVDRDELSEDDLRVIADDNVADSAYVSDLVNEIYSEAGLKGTAEERAKLWISTLNRFYYHGIESGDSNGMYEFVGDDGVENCRTCKKLKGQVHRMKDWVRKELRPGIDHDNFECGTWEPNCSHYLEKTTGKAKGNWL